MNDSEKHSAVIFFDEIKGSIDWEGLWPILNEHIERAGRISRIEDSSPLGRLTVNISCDGDAIVSVDEDPNVDRPGGGLTFCTRNGGGRSPRVRTALILLAIAMAADNAESPIGDR